MTAKSPKDKNGNGFGEEFGQSRIGHRLIMLEEVDSTNLYAIQHSDSFADGTVIIARKQLAGRGRKGRVWHSPPGFGLYLSFLLKKTDFLGESHILNLLSSLAVHDTVKESLKDGKKADSHMPLELKWPNDVIYDSLKLAGILSERKGGYGDNAPTVVGIGINVNHKESDFPPDLADRGISLYMIDSKKRETLEVARELIRNINRRFHELRSKGSGYIINSWMQCSPACRGSRVRVISDNEEFQAVTEGLDQRGFLKVRRYGDRLQTILSADIVSVRRV